MYVVRCGDVILFLSLPNLANCVLFFLLYPPMVPAMFLMGKVKNLDDILTIAGAENLNNFFFSSKISKTCQSSPTQ